MIFLDFLYFIVLLALSPWLLYTIVVKKKYWDTLAQRLGLVIPIEGKQAIWIHGVSVGEIKAAKPLILRIRKALPERQIIVSSTSRSGKKIALELYPDCKVISFPLDFSWTIKHYFKRINPCLIVLMELELWPNFLHLAHKRKIPVVLVNGRLSEKSFRGYSRLRCIFRWMTRAINVFAMQTEIYKKRMLQLGIKEGNIQITGNMKFDSEILPGKENSIGLEFPSELQIIVAGSTHNPEEKILIDSYCDLRVSFPNLRLIIVPRNPNRAKEIAQWVREKGLNAVLKSQIKNGREFPENDIIIGDVMGELAKIYQLSHIAFVGGSLIPHGGQNFIEPASLGKAVICGPFMHNFPETRVFVEQNAMLQLSSAKNIKEAFHSLLNDINKANKMGQSARNLVEKSRGSSERNCTLCMNLIHEKTFIIKDI